MEVIRRCPRHPSNGAYPSDNVDERNDVVIMRNGDIVLAVRVGLTRVVVLSLKGCRTDSHIAHGDIFVAPGRGSAILHRNSKSIPRFEFFRFHECVAQVFNLAQSGFKRLKNRSFEHGVMPNEFINRCSDQNRVLLILQNLQVPFRGEDGEKTGNDCRPRG